MIVFIDALVRAETAGFHGVELHEGMVMCLHNFCRRIESKAMSVSFGRKTTAYLRNNRRDRCVITSSRWCQIVSERLGWNSKMSCRAYDERGID